MTQYAAALSVEVKPRSRVRARRGLWLFFALLVPASALLEGLTIMSGQIAWIALLMWTPGLASLITRGILREGFDDISFRLGGRRGVQALLLSLVTPIVVGLVAYGIAWSTGLAQFAPPASSVFPTVNLPLARFGLLLISVFGIDFLVSLILAMGEEIGWRGYMLTRLIDAGVPQPVLVSGLIWGVWHLPLILSGQYAAGPNLLVSVVFFMTAITVSAFLYAWLRLSSGSIWPAIVLHGAWNSTIQDAFDASTTGAQWDLWVGESGIVVTLVIIVAVVLLRRSWRPAAESSELGNV